MAKYEIQATFAETDEDLTGYNIYHYFNDRGACLDKLYDSPEEAITAAEAQYKGPDDDGIGLVIEARETED